MINDQTTETLKNNVSSPEGSSLEALINRPFEGYTYIKKEWVDQEDNIEKVTINVTLSPQNLPADWSKVDSFVMMPEWGTVPLKRSWILRLPTHFQDCDQYLFHYFFHIHYTNASERISSTFSQLIVPQSFEFIDYAGENLFVRLHWSVGSWTYPQNTEMECDGIEWGSEFSVSNLPYRRDDPLFYNGRALVMERLPAPRRFRAIISAPRRAEIKYCFQMSSLKNDTLENFWDNNFGRDFSLTI
ncbi:MAG: hypothetical protein HQM10_12160 [Candidatus Riflebacteria bacterium]|nr:hypothetical protein [Candidatus Riflebacteria bacterium]